MSSNAGAPLVIARMAFALLLVVLCSQSAPFVEAMRQHGPPQSQPDAAAVSAGAGAGADALSAAISPNEGMIDRRDAELERLLEFQPASAAAAASLDSEAAPLPAQRREPAAPPSSASALPPGAEDEVADAASHAPLTAEAAPAKVSVSASALQARSGGSSEGSRAKAAGKRDGAGVASLVTDAAHGSVSGSTDSALGGAERRASAASGEASNGGSQQRAREQTSDASGAASSVGEGASRREGVQSVAAGLLDRSRAALSSGAAALGAGARGALASLLGIASAASPGSAAAGAAPDGAAAGAVSGRGKVLPALLVFGLLVLVSVWKVYLPRPEGMAHILELARHRREYLRQEFAATVSALEGVLLGMTESPAYAAEFILEDKRRSFVNFLKQVSEHTERLSDGLSAADRSVRPLRKFATLWLSVFEQCSLDPWSKPNLPVKSQELVRCTTLKQIARLVGGRLERAEVRLIRSVVESTRNVDLSLPKDEPKMPWVRFGYCGFSIISWGLLSPEHRSAAAAPATPQHPHKLLLSTPSGGPGLGASKGSPLSSSSSSGSSSGSNSPSSSSGANAAVARFPAALSSAPRTPPKPQRTPQRRVRLPSPKSGGGGGTPRSAEVAREKEERRRRQRTRHGSGEAATESKESQHARPSAYPIDCSVGWVRFFVLSQVHFLMLIAAGTGLLALALEAIYGRNLFIAMGIVIAEACVVVLLLRIQDVDEVARLHGQVMLLEERCAEVAHRERALIRVYSGLRPLGKLWQLRTVPCLEHLAELHALLWETPETGKVTLLAGIADRLERVLDSLGPLELWFGERSLDEDMLNLVAEQLSICTDFVCKNRTEKAVGPLVLSRMDRVFGFLIVRVRSAKQLEASSSASIATPLTGLAPFVELSLGSDITARTEVFSGGGDPAWNQEFTLPVRWNHQKFELSVLSGGSALGSVQVVFRDAKSEVEPGVWQRRTDHLLSPKKKPEPSELTYDVFFATEVEQLGIAFASPLATQRESSPATGAGPIAFVGSTGSLGSGGVGAVTGTGGRPLILGLSGSSGGTGGGVGGVSPRQQPRSLNGFLT